MKFQASLTILVLALLTLGCKQQTEVRKPVSKSSGSFMKSSIERTKTQVESETQLIQAAIAKDSTQTYLSSSSGFWYAYEIQNIKDSLRPKTGDLVEFEYEVLDLNKKLLYTKEELDLQEYLVDKEDLMTGLRLGIKLMKPGEKVRFIFPSQLAYGYLGDQTKVGINEPIICEVHLIAITNEKQKTIK